MNTALELNGVAATLPDPMSIARHGKIARLPRNLREELNQRLAAGQVGREILAWINGQPEAREVLGREFAGKPINHQNLSDWRRHGYREWRLHQEATEQVGKRASTMPSGAALRAAVIDEVGRAMAVECVARLQQIREAGLHAKTRWKYVSEGLQELQSLRRHEYREGRRALAEEKASHRKRSKETPSDLDRSPSDDIRTPRESFKVIQGEKAITKQTSNIEHPTTNIQRNTGENTKIQTPNTKEISNSSGGRGPSERADTRSGAKIVTNPEESKVFKVKQSSPCVAPDGGWAQSASHSTSNDTPLESTDRDLVSEVIAEVFNSHSKAGRAAPNGSALFKAIQGGKLELK